MGFGPISYTPAPQPLPQRPPAFPLGAPPYPADRGRQRTGGGFLAAAAVFHLISIPVALFVFQALVSLEAGRSVSLGEIFDALNRTGNGILVVLIVAGAFAQVAFAVIAGVGSFMMYRGRSVVAVPMMVAGIIAIIISLLVFGGILGLIGGVLSLVGGIKAYSPPRAYYFAPPPYYPPPYYPPPARPP